MIDERGLAEFIINEIVKQTGDTILDGRADHLAEIIKSYIDLDPDGRIVWSLCMEDFITVALDDLNNDDDSCYEKWWDLDREISGTLAKDFYNRFRNGFHIYDWSEAVHCYLLDNLDFKRRLKELIEEASVNV